MKPSALWWIAALAGVFVLAGLSWRPALASSPGMPTLALKPKKPARRKPAAAKTKRALRLPPSMEISPISGLPVVKARPGQKPVTPEMIKAALPELPPPRANAADLLRDLDDGTFAAAAGKGDWGVVEKTAKGRRSRLLRAA